MWGGGEQLRDSKAWRRSVELSKEQTRRGRWLPSGRGFLEGQRKDGRRAVSA